MERSPLDLGKTKASRNLWNDARTLPIGRARDLARLRIPDADGMPTRSYSRSPAASESHYNAVDKAPFNYAEANNSVYSINTVHLRNPYRGSLQRPQGYAPHNQSKDTHRWQDSSLRWRYDNNLVANREPNRSGEQENEKVDSSSRSMKRGSRVFSVIGDLVKQYCSSSSLHGLRYIGDSQLSIVERAFWLIAFTSVLTLGIYYICYLFHKWTSSPIIISLSPEPVSLSEFPFPSMTICNMNHAKKTEARRIEKGSDLLEKLLLEDICNSENANMTYDDEHESINSERMMLFMINVTQPCTDMLYYCQWRGNQSDCEKIFNPTMTDEGICCNFNAVNQNFLFYNAHEWPFFNISYPSGYSVDWNAENGYEKDTPSDAIPWRTYGAGQYYGLTLVLDVDTSEYYCSSTASVGFKFLLHNPVETPKIADFAFAITPGEETRVIVRPKISTASKTILTIPRTKRKCFFTTERKLRYYRTYTQRNCILECEANFTQQMCNCVQYYMPKSSRTPICAKKDEQCAKLARRAMELKLYDDEFQNTINRTIPSCNCWPGCFEINYKVELSQSKLLSTYAVHKKYIKKDMNYFTENMAVVHLFFVDSQFTKYVKTELFGFIEFLSNTGGLLGLFMGFSFLSFMEILYFATMRLCCRLYGRRVSSKSTMLRIHPLDHRKKTIYPFVN